METPNNIILLYSKFSPNCKRFMDMIRDNNLSFIFPLCIDNQKVREMVLKSVYKIQNVPCLLVTYASGGVEKYEGQSAFSWTEDLVQKMTPPIPESQHQPQPQNPRLSEEIIEEANELHPPRARKHPPHPQQSNKKGVTSVDDLISLDDEEEEAHPRDPLNGLAPRISNPKMNIGEPIDEDFEDPQKIDEKVKKAVKNANGGSSIMARAQEMQKIRDREAEKSRLPIPQTART